MGFRITARRAIPVVTAIAVAGLAVPAILVGATPSPAPQQLADAAFAPVVIDEPDGLAFASRVLSTEQRDDTLDPAPITRSIAERLAPKGRVAAAAMPKPAPKPKPKPAAASGHAASFATGPTSAARARVVRIALAQLHDRYVAGGTGPDTFDCSGLVRYAYEQAGVGDMLGGGHSASAMLAWGRANGLTSRGGGRPGDVVIYGNGSHAAIYLGNGKIVSALNPSQGIRVTGLYALGAPFTAFIHTRI